MKFYNEFMARSAPEYDFAKFTPKVFSIDFDKLEEIRKEVGHGFKVEAIEPTKTEQVGRESLTDVAKLYVLVDVSGSMNKGDKEHAAAIADLVKQDLETMYKTVDIKVIAHHTSAVKNITSLNDLVKSKETGGTIVSSAYKEVSTYGSVDRYIVQITDGDNWADDTETVREVLGKLVCTGSTLRGIKYFEIGHRKQQGLGKMMDKLSYVDTYYMGTGSLDLRKSEEYLN